MRLFSLLLATLLAATVSAAEPERPNIVLILADDVGYGDLGCYGATRVATPHLDRLAAAGLRFTDGHAASATCTPTRYALITGEYAWRKKGTGVLPGDANLIVEPGRMTLPAMLKRAGYATGVVGKWHLGLGSHKIDWNGEISPGPREIGFDYSFLIPGTGDRVPCVYVENQRVAGLDPADPIEVSYAAKVGDEPTGRDHPELLKMKLSHGHDFTIVNGISRIGWMKGGRSARWVDEDMADTLVIFTSDNGPVLDDGYADGAVADLNGHKPAGPLRGGKYSLYEGGTRVPFLVRWPARIKPGVSDALVCQVDLLASLASLVGETLPKGAGPDSENVLSALVGESSRGRELLVEHAAGLALRKGAWKYIPARSPPGKAKPAGRPSPAELYNLADDLGETKNLASEQPEMVRELDEALSEIRDRRRE